MKEFLEEFKAFAMRGNVIDLAVGVIIGGAFGKIVSAVVANIIMPPIGLLLGGVNFSDLALVLKEAEGATPAVIMNYGLFIQATVDFIIVAFCIFMFIKALSGLKNKKVEEPVAPPAPSAEVLLLTEIRDLLKK